MTTPVDRITAVLRKHVSAQTQNWETKLRCECGQGDFSSKLEYAAHVAEQVAAELKLTELIETINNFWMVDKDGELWVNQGYLLDIVSAWSAVEEKP